MPRPLNLFIHAHVDNYQQRLGYGETLPQPLRLQLHEQAAFAFLEATEAEANIFACASGYLSTRFPDDSLPREESELPAPAVRPTPDTLLLYLHPRPFLDLYPGFAARAREVIDDPTSPLAPQDSFLGAFRPPPGNITGFFYLNVDAATLKETLRQRYQLDALVEMMSSLHLGAATLPPPATDLEFEQRWALFLEGQIDIPVRAGDALGEGGDPQLTPPVVGANGRQLGFGVLTTHGTVDPAYFYDYMRDFVVEETEVDALLGVMPVNWPPLADAGDMHLTTQRIFAFSALQRLRRSATLTPGQWRQVGNNQKALYRERLLQRLGHAPAGSTAPIFQFNDADWRNLFQLEAVTEFYANFSDPWRPGEAPQGPGAIVDLLPLRGSAATVNGSEVSLDGNLNWSRVWSGRDTIYLHGDTARPNRTYKIIGFNEAANSVLVDGTPNVVGQTAWLINDRPTLILIDSHGPRQSGWDAQVVAGSPDVVELDAVANLNKVNRHGFESIYFHDDQSDHRIYKIVDVDAANRRVTLDRAPNLGGNPSRWGLPAGVGGEPPALAYNLGRNDARGWDHYDGVMFVVQNGIVRERFRWTSYTSHNYNPATAGGQQARSSVRGNQLYFTRSYRSGNAFRNFSFKVVDRGGVLQGGRATLTAPNMVALDGAPDLSLVQHTGAVDGRDRIVLFGDSNRADGRYRIDGVDDANDTLTLDGDPALAAGYSGWEIETYDGVRENRLYFEAVVAHDNAPAGSRPSYNPAAPAFVADGKTEIRLHYGLATNAAGGQANGSGSAGCLVSPVYYGLRNQLIDFYQAEWEALNGPGMSDPDINQVRLLVTHPQNQAAYPGIPAGFWNNKIVAPLWLIRPDERPLP